VEFERTELTRDGKLCATGESWSIDADIVFKAVGQAVAADVLTGDGESLQQEHGKLLVDEDRRTTLTDVWAGGDCIFGHDDLTVSAVQDGKIAAIAIDRFLSQA